MKCVRNKIRRTWKNATTSKVNLLKPSFVSKDFFTNVKSLISNQFCSSQCLLKMISNNTFGAWAQGRKWRCGEPTLNPFVSVFVGTRVRSLVRVWASEWMSVFAYTWSCEFMPTPLLCVSESVCVSHQQQRGRAVFSFQSKIVSKFCKVVPTHSWT